MAKKLQIALKADTDKNGSYDVNVTPVDIEINEATALALESAIAVADVNDAIPGNGEFEVKQAIKAPVKINLFITSLKTNVNIDAEVVIRVVDR